MSFGGRAQLTGDDLATAPFLPGGIWFMLACYGAGTPDASAYRHWLEGLRSAGHFGGSPDAVLKGLPRDGERPFIAALPQSVLANPDGPLAFMGHVDLAWTYSFSDLDTGSQVNRPAKFFSLLRFVLLRQRVGVAFRELWSEFGRASTELATIYGDEEQARSSSTSYTPQAARRGHLWMLRQDLAGYILLGDPAVRLPLAPPRPVERAPAPSLFDALGLPPPAAAPPPSMSPAMPPLLPIERLEEAIGHVLVGELGPKAIATRYGIERAELERLVELYRQGGRAALSR
jgi:hypothetical protein